MNRFPLESESACDCRGYPMSSTTAAKYRCRGASFEQHSVIHTYHCEDTRRTNGTQKVLWSIGGADDDSVYGITMRVADAANGGPYLRFTLVLGRSGSTPSNPMYWDASGVILPYGRTIVLVLTATGDTTSATFNLYAYIDGKKITLTRTGGPTSTNQPTEATLFNYTCDGFIASRTGFQNAVGTHGTIFLNTAVSEAEADQIGAIPWVGAATVKPANLWYAAGVFTVEGTTGGAGNRPELPVAAATSVVIDRGAASNPDRILAARAPATLTANVVQFVDPFEQSGIPAPGPNTTLSGGAPAGWAVGAPVYRNAPKMLAHQKAWATGVVSAAMIVAVVANSRISIDTAVRFPSGPGSRALVRSFSGNFVDFDFFYEHLNVARGRHNFQPPLSTTNGGAWGFDCQLDAPLMTGSSCQDLAKTTASRFGTASRVGGPTTPTVLGPGDPIRIPASASYRLLACPELGLAIDDALRFYVDLQDYPSASAPTIIAEAAKHYQNGANVLSGRTNETVPTMGTTMSAVSFTSYNASTRTFVIDDTSGALDTLKVGDMWEVLDSSGNTFAEPLLAVVSAVTGRGTSSASVVIDNPIGWYRTVSSIATGTNAIAVTVDASVAGLVAAGDSAIVLGTAATPTINGTWPVASVSGAVVTLTTNVTVTGAQASAAGDIRFVAALATPANYRVKWCPPAIVRVYVSHPASVADANWRGLKITAGGTGGGVIVLGFGVSNVSRPGLEIMPIGWSGRGWLDQWTQMSRVISERDGKSLAQKRFETLAPDLCYFSVADQGNAIIASFPDYAIQYIQLILSGAPNCQMVMAGDVAHSASDFLPNVTDVATSYNNHHAALNIVAARYGYPYLTLIGDAPSGRGLPGNVWAQLARGMLLDGTAHQFRGFWRGVMEQVGRFQIDRAAALGEQIALGPVGSERARG